MVENLPGTYISKDSALHFKNKLQVTVALCLENRAHHIFPNSTLDFSSMILELLLTEAVVSCDLKQLAASSTPGQFEFNITYVPRGC